MSAVWEVAPHPDECPGAFRRHDITPFAGGVTPPPWTDAPAQVHEWATAADRFGHQVRAGTIGAEDIPVTLTGLHCDVERVHPFLDRNGRAGRLVLNLVRAYLESCHRRRDRPS